MAPKRRGKKKAPAAAASYPTASSEEKPVGEWWEEFSARARGSHGKEIASFQSMFKISIMTFDYICSLVREDLLSNRGKHCDYSNGAVLSVRDQVAVALRRLSSGDSLESIGSSFHMDKTTVANVTRRFSEAMEVRGTQHLKWHSPEELERVKLKFKAMQGLPNCCGAMDTTHILMLGPYEDDSNKAWYDHEKKRSINLQAVVDADMRFVDTVIGWPGVMNDSLVLEHSGFFKLCQRGERLANKETLSVGGGGGGGGGGYELREYILGDEGYPLLPWLITPYTGKNLAGSQAEFNRRHRETRMVAGKALAKLKNMWKLLQDGVRRPDPEKLPTYIFACCKLHNIIIDLEDDARNEAAQSYQHDKGYKQQICKTVSEEGATLRDWLSQCLSDQEL